MSNWQDEHVVDPLLSRLPEVLRHARPEIPANALEIPHRIQSLAQRFIAAVLATYLALDGDPPVIGAVATENVGYLACSIWSRKRM